jgi:hypothetical protein
LAPATAMAYLEADVRRNERMKEGFACWEIFEQVLNFGFIVVSLRCKGFEILYFSTVSCNF